MIFLQGLLCQEVPRPPMGHQSLPRTTKLSHTMPGHLLRLLAHLQLRSPSHQQCLRHLHSRTPIHQARLPPAHLRVPWQPQFLWLGCGMQA